MERSEIRDRWNRETVPGLRFAPSGLRFLERSFQRVARMSVSEMRGKSINT